MNKQSDEGLRAIVNGEWSVGGIIGRELATELIALRESMKGEQLPVGEIVAWSGTDIEKGITREVDFRFLRFDVQPGQQLFTAPQKPVVVLNSSTVMSRNYVVKQIEAAGGVVKDGEAC